jgi:hypothetical protein
MNQKSPVLLVTTATNPPDGVIALKMKNIAKRIITAKAAVFYWAALGMKKIVIADATGQTLLDNSEQMMLQQMGIEIEQINYYQNNDLVVKKGKGYGEGLLLKFALQNSCLIQNASHFLKCTGKVYCRNIGDISNIIINNNIKSIFWRNVFDNFVDTRFFYTSKRFYEENIIPAYENIDDSKSVWAEHVLLKVAHEQLRQGKTIRPILSGFSGSMNQPYFDLSMGFLDQNMPCWIKY